MIDEQSKLQLMRYIDQELSNEEMLEIEKQIIANPEYHSFIQEQRALKDMMQAAFAELDEQPIPNNITSSITPHQESVIKMDNYRKSPKIKSRWLWPTALAASITGAYLLGMLTVESGHGMQANTEVQGKVAIILDQQPGGQRMDNLVLHGSYLNDTGEFCRHFTQHQDELTDEVLSCRDSDGIWQIKLKRPAVPENAYQLAGDETATQLEIPLQNYSLLNQRQERRYLTQK